MRRLVLAVAAVLSFSASAALADSYSYRPGLHPDPFKAPSSDEVPARCDTGVLCGVDVQELKLTALVTGQSVPMAMVEDKKGEAHVIRRGDFVGRGRVEAIRSDRVVLVEVHLSPSGPVRVTRELKMAP